MKHLTFFVFALFSAFNFAQAQNTNPYWINYTNGDWVNGVAIEGDSLWIATLGGLVLLDTTHGLENFYNVSNSDLSSNSVSTIKIDHNHNKWILTGKGIDELSSTGTWTHYNPSEYSSNSNSFHIDQFDDVYTIGVHPVFGTACLARIRGGVTTYLDSLNSGMPRTIVKALTTDQFQNLWVVAGDYIIKYDGTNWTVMDSSYTGLNTVDIFSFTVDANQRYWLSSYFDILFFDGASWTDFSSNNSPLNNYSLDGIAADNTGKVYICNNQQLLLTDGVNWWRYDTTNCPAAAYRFFSIQIDPQNHLFVGTTNNGLYVFNNGSWGQYNLSNSGIDNNGLDQVILTGRKKALIRTYISYSFMDDTTWTTYQPFPPGISTEPSGMGKNDSNTVWCSFRYNSAPIAGPIASIFNGSTWNYASFTNRNCNDVTVDHNNVVWYGTNTGLIKFDGIDTLSYTPVNSPLADTYIMRVFADRNNNIWINTPYGALQKFDGVNWQTINTNGFPGLPLQGITEDYTGAIWMSAGWLGTGVHTSIGKYNGTSWSMITNTPGTFPMSLAIDNDNNLWAAIVDAGLGKYDGNSWTLYTPANSGLPETNISDIKIDEYNNIWIATRSSGLVLFNEKGVNFDTLAQQRIPVTGTCFFDADSNGIKSFSEPFLSGQTINELPDNYTSITNNQGFYNMTLMPGSYTISVAPDSGWRVSTDSLQYHVALNSTNGAPTLNFGLTASPFSKYLFDVSSAPMRCGFTAPIWMHYSNHGSSRDSGFVRFVMDSSASFGTAFPYPNAINGNVYDWHFSNTIPFKDRNIALYIHVPNLPGNILHEHAGLFYYSNGVPVLVDSISFNDEIICAADPNDKLVDPIGAGLSHDILFNDTLTYTIRFQNVGNDTAFFIKIIDTLSANLDVNTFQFISSNEIVNVSKNGQTLTFDIPNCILPPAGINEQFSHGYLKFKIKPNSTILPNTLIQNSANIYFNFNDHIRTNEVFNTIVDSLNLAIVSPIASEEGISIYPNPTDNEINVIYPNLKHDEFHVELLSAAGTKVIELNDKTGRFRLMFDKKPAAGIYFLLISSSEKRYSAKISFN